MALRLFDNPTLLSPPRTLRQELPGGGFVLRSPEPLQPYARCVGEWLEYWATQTPDTAALAERNAQHEWDVLSYAQVRQAVGAIAQSLLDLQLPSDAPIVVLSDNSIDHALLMLAAQHIGQPFCTVSSAYCRLTRDYTKIVGILHTLQPGLIYASQPDVYGPAITAAGLSVPVVFSHHAADFPGAMAFSQLRQTQETPAVRAAFNAITPDTVAKYLLTSGSTGNPKVVINTHRMLCANQQMMAQTWRFLEQEKPIVIDWLPWSHTFGSNHNFNMVLRNGGTLYIDEGRPAPGLIEHSIRNLREVRPNLYFNVPSGFDMLLPSLEADDELASALFSRLRLAFYAGAALPQASWERLEKVAARVRQEPVWFTTSWGATETAPAVTSAHWKLDRAGVIGLPLPGTELKFVPNGNKLEMRVRGPSVFPGYRNAPEQTRQAFDEEGYYLIGDGGYLLDPQKPEAGVVFDGRVSEDFKLTTGTWVSVGTLRIKLISTLAPYVRDAVITGHDRNEVGALLFLSPVAAELPQAELIKHIRDGLIRLRDEGGGSSQTLKRVLILADAPNADAGEITDKGYINQRAVLQRRAADVLALYSDGADSRVILATETR